MAKIFHHRFRQCTTLWWVGGLTHAPSAGWEVDQSPRHGLSHRAPFQEGWFGGHFGVWKHLGWDTRGSTALKVHFSKKKNVWWISWRRRVRKRGILNQGIAGQIRPQRPIAYKITNYKIGQRWHFDGKWHIQTPKKSNLDRSGRTRNPSGAVVHFLLQGWMYVIIWFIRGLSVVEV